VLQRYRINSNIHGAVINDTILGGVRSEKLWHKNAIKHEKNLWPLPGLVSSFLCLHWWLLVEAVEGFFESDLALLEWFQLQSGKPTKNC
jgi:hypothetical protein